MGNGKLISLSLVCLSLLIFSLLKLRKICHLTLFLPVSHQNSSGPHEAYLGRQRSGEVSVPLPLLNPVCTPQVWALGNQKVGFPCKQENTCFFSNRGDSADTSRFIRLTNFHIWRSQECIIVSLYCNCCGNGRWHFFGWPYNSNVQ